MADVTINDVLNDFDKLNDADKEFFLEIARKQYIEQKRNQIADRIKEAEQNYTDGKTKSGDVDSLLKDLNDD